MIIDEKKREVRRERLEVRVRVKRREDNGQRLEVRSQRLKVREEIREIIYCFWASYFIKVTLNEEMPIMMSLLA